MPEPFPSQMQPLFYAQVLSLQSGSPTPRTSCPKFSDRLSCSCPAGDLGPSHLPAVAHPWHQAQDTIQFSHHTGSHRLPRGCSVGGVPRLALCAPLCVWMVVRRPWGCTGWLFAPSSSCFCSLPSHVCTAQLSAGCEALVRDLHGALEGMGCGSYHSAAVCSVIHLMPWHQDPPLW